MSRPTATADRTGSRFLVRAFNRLAPWARHVGIGPARLDAEGLLEWCRKRTGLDDLGDGDPWPAVQALTRSYEEDARLHPAGRLMARVSFLGLLCTRLRLVRAFRVHADALQRPLERPIFIVGLPRTGTTLLYKLLGSAGGLRPLLAWESFCPVPLPEETGGKDRRLTRTRAGLRVSSYLTPGLQVVHPVVADEPEECIGLQQHTLRAHVALLYARLEGYEQWLDSQEPASFVEAYRFYRKQLLLLQELGAEGATGGGGARRWVLKSPAHLRQMDALCAVFPDAVIIRTHRHLAKVLPSTCSLFALTRGTLSDQVDPLELGARALEEAARAVEIEVPLPASQVVDVLYEDLMADPAGAVRGVLARARQPIPDALDRGVEEWLTTHRQNRHGAHRYSLEQFGIGPSEIEERFAGYHRRFGMAPPSS